MSALDSTVIADTLESRKAPTILYNAACGSVIEHTEAEVGRSVGETRSTPKDQRDRSAKLQPAARCEWFSQIGPGSNCVAVPLSFRLKNYYTPDSPLTVFNPTSNRLSTLYTMAVKTFARTLRAASKQKISAGSLQKRGFSSALAARPAVAAPRAAFIAPVQQQTRGVKTIDFAGTKEKVYGLSANQVEIYKAD
jgi:hypothetical protein